MLFSINLDPIYNFCTFKDKDKCTHKFVYDTDTLDVAFALKKRGTLSDYITHFQHEIASTHKLSDLE